MRQVPRRDWWRAARAARGFGRGKERSARLEAALKNSTTWRPRAKRPVVETTPVEPPPVMEPTPVTSAPAPRPDSRTLVEAALRERSEAVRLALLEQAFQTDPDDMTAMSFYGLALARVRRNWSQGIAFCEEALRRRGLRPELLANLALTWLAANNRREAARMLARLASQHPNHPCTEEVREALGRRRPPVLPLLPRGFFLNRWLGRLRHRWLDRRALPST